jgi:hypothetical protein
LEVMCRLDWQADYRAAVVVTHAPCHGKRFHSLRDDHFPDDVDPHGDATAAAAAASATRALIC